MSLRRKGSQLWLWTTIWSGATFTGCCWFTLRRVGMSTDYARIRYLTSAGEYRMLLEAGAYPDNRYLPPHLRLDQRSYLDYDETRIAEAPVYDLTLTDKDLALQATALLPPGERRELKMQNSLFSSHTVILPVTRENRLVKRRLGLSPSEKAKMAQENPSGLNY